MFRKYKVKVGRLLETVPGMLMFLIGVNIVMLTLLGFFYLLLESMFP